MFIYVLENKDPINVVNIPNPTAYRIGNCILELMDKYGPNKNILISQKNVTKPIDELIKHDLYVET
jgi:hypothetical protein